ncbi:Rrf2 family transcriptional regulator [Pedobacter chitinilyticus]|uniref:Rrf2 family transcriptional regulator n=1 Tax=Pedobacter chitinilyticus TaxID=2233776 RepID=A0A3S3Q0G7_9SPHI|nr:Rrf2 family transcriptional regulator [Pedobacter chitinilyticus]RWU10035.1 Rrf2 family transcriptional regulator [Pedobacter chitinilyticus]
MNNGRFAISLHILVLLDKAKGELLSSDYMAGSININPVLVRKELVNLREYGLVTSKEGKNGGSALAKPANKITLGALYQSVKGNYLLGSHKNDPNPLCEVGKDINNHLNDLYSETEMRLIDELNKQTLADFSNRFT